MFGQGNLALDTAYNLPANWIPVSVMGRNPDVDTGTVPEDIWPGGGVFVPPTTARVHAIVSNNAADKGVATAGAGLRTVNITGVDASYNLVTETLTTNGTTPVSTNGSYLSIDLAGATFGSDGVNDGIISATAATDATVSNQILSGHKRSTNTYYIVPAGYTAFILRWFAALQSSTSGAEATVALQYQLFGGSWSQKAFEARLSRLNGRRIFEQRFNDRQWIELPAKTAIKCTAFDVAKDNMDICAGYDLVLVAD